MYEAVVFDMDGVIFDSERAVMGCWMELAAKYNIENMHESFLACTGTTMKRTREIMLERYGQSFPYDQFAKEASISFHKKYDGGRLPLKTGVKNILNYLKDNNKKIALASSTRKQVVDNELKEAGLFHYFDVVIGGDMVTNSKPAPDIFLKACEELGVNAENAFAVEDSYNGIRSAASGKLKAIMVPDLLEPNEEMNELAVAIRANLDEVIEYLKIQG